MINNDLTKLEEDYAFQFYKSKILPSDVWDFNNDIETQIKAYRHEGLRTTTVQEVTSKMKKIIHGQPGTITGGDRLYIANLYTHPELGDVMFRLEMEREKVGVISLRYYHTFGAYTFKKELVAEGIFEPRDPNWGLITKEEEDEGLNAIKRIWVPKAVEMWNKIHRKYKVTVPEVLRGLRKTRHDSRTDGTDVFGKSPRSDVIHYEYFLPQNPKKLYLVFMIHRFSNPFGEPNKPNHFEWQDRTLMAGFFSGTALFEMPVYPQKPRFTGLSEGLDPELEDFKISKVEEDEALHFIKKTMIPDIVSYYNENRASNYIRNHPETEVTVKGLLRSLKKLHHVRIGEPGVEADEIEYQTEMPYSGDSNKFTFSIVKEVESHGWLSLVIIYAFKIGTNSTLKSNVIRRIKRVRDSDIIQENVRPIHNLTKQEEDEAFDFLKRRIVPLAVKATNEFLKNRHGAERFIVTPSMVLRSLRKIDQTENTVLFNAIIEKDLVLDFRIEKAFNRFVIEKYGRPIIYIGFYDKSTGRLRHFDLHDPVKKPMNEGVESSGSPILSREEEAIGLRFIKLALVPHAVERGNKWIERNHANFAPSTVQQVLRGLRKTGQSQPVETGWSAAEYQYTEWVDGQAQIPLRFMVVKSRERDILHWRLMAGVEDPMSIRDEYYIVQFDEQGKPILDFK